MTSLGDQIPDERIEGIWRQILDVFRGGILADWFVVCFIFLSFLPDSMFLQLYCGDFSIGCARSGGKL